MAAADPRTGIATSQLSYALCLGGRHVEADAVIRDELDRQAEIGTLRRFRPFLVTDLVDGYIDLGRWDEAVALCEAELAQADGGRPAPWYLESLAEIRAKRGDVEEAGELLGAASAAVGPGDAVIDRVWVMRAAIVLGRIEGNIDRVRSAIDEALSISADTAHDAPLWWLLCAALAAEADEADHAMRRRDEGGVATAQARGRRLVRILDEAASALGSDDRQWPPTLRAYVRHGAADRLRLEGDSDIPAWVAAIAAYDDLGTSTTRRAAVSAWPRRSWRPVARARKPCPCCALRPTRRCGSERIRCTQRWPALPAARASTSAPASRPTTWASA